MSEQLKIPFDKVACNFCNKSIQNCKPKDLYSCPNFEYHYKEDIEYHFRDEYCPKVCRNSWCAKKSETVLHCLALMRCKEKPYLTLVRE